MPRIYIMWHEGGWGASGFISCAALTKEKLIENDDSIHGEEILIYDSETGQEIGTCSKLITFTDGHTCRCDECKTDQTNCTEGNK